MLRGYFSFRTILVGIVVLLMVVYIGYRFYIGTAINPRTSTIALLIPDDIASDDALIGIWRDAAHEEGIDANVVRVSEYLRPSIREDKHSYAGIIMPDTLHQSVNRLLLNRLQDDVRAGSWLMLVYDAATHSANDKWYAGKAPLSTLVGIDYGLYDELREKTFERGVVLVPEEAMHTLSIPPGKTIPFSGQLDTQHNPELRALSGYVYGQLNYPVITTRGKYEGLPILTTASGSLVAGVHKVERGGVLFVNLPIGYLKGQTDGLLLHGFLHYFAADLLHLPILMATPEGIGGLVFNWHVDSGAAIAPIQELDSLGLLDQGPFSIHFTAGPDTYKIGDGAGLDLRNNKELAPWIDRFKKRGDTLGSHGGWIHNYFGLTVTEQNQAEMQQYLEMNNDAVQAVSGEPVREYSAPIGNQPKWVTAWLEAHGVLAYYFTGNSGMAPTRSYRDGTLQSRQIWSFPISILGDVASFEEASDAQMDSSAVSKWLIGLSDFAADTGTVRTIYSHPTGWHRYMPAIQEWFARTKALSEQKRFRWYTMTRIAEFLSRREQVQWSVTKTQTSATFTARHPVSLEEMTWQLPKRFYQRPKIESGVAEIFETGDSWRVSAGAGRELHFTSQTLEEHP